MRSSVKAWVGLAVIGVALVGAGLFKQQASERVKLKVEGGIATYVAKDKTTFYIMMTGIAGDKRKSVTVQEFPVEQAFYSKGKRARYLVRESIHDCASDNMVIVEKVAVLDDDWELIYGSETPIEGKILPKTNADIERAYICAPTTKLGDMSEGSSTPSPLNKVLKGML